MLNVFMHVTIFIERIWYRIFMCQNNNEFFAEQLKKKCCTVVRLKCCTKIKNFFRENI